MSFRALSAVIVALSLSVASALPAVAVDRAPANAVTRACVNLDTSMMARSRCATALTAALKAEPEAAGILKGAVKSGKTVSTEQLLMRLGLTKEQLAAADIQVKSEGTEGARIKDVSVEISCCPLKITIIIRF